MSITSTTTTATSNAANSPSTSHSSASPSSRSSSVSSAASPGTTAPPTVVKKKFPCAHPGCGKSFSRSEHLHRHALNHQDGNSTCQRCSAHFRRRDLLERHLQRHKEKDDEAGGEGLGILATRKRLWRDANGNIVNSRRPSLSDSKEIARRRMENARRNSEAAVAAAKANGAQSELGAQQTQNQQQLPTEGQTHMKREGRPQHLKTRSLGRIPTASHPISIHTPQQLYIHQSNIRSPVEDFSDYMQQQQHSSWGVGIHTPPLSAPGLSVSASSYSTSASTSSASPSSEHSRSDERNDSDHTRHPLLTPPLESTSWPDLHPHIPLFTASPSPVDGHNFEYPSPHLHSQPWSTSSSHFSQYPPPPAPSHDVLHYDGLDLDLDLEIFKQESENGDDRLGAAAAAVDWAVHGEAQMWSRERGFACGAATGGLGPRGLGYGSTC
ncbi:hypothetical protein F5884DRAFT_450170 [Xylogone sp. PMI_703]|nr:hypothetical protein F5884DRAFT_450170 [Xylogone sp. PMI_703]